MINQVINSIKKTLVICEGDESVAYKLFQCEETLKLILEELQEYQSEQEQDSDPWGVLGALDEATKIR